MPWLVSVRVQLCVTAHSCTHTVYVQAVLVSVPATTSVVASITKHYLYPEET